MSGKHWDLIVAIRLCRPSLSQRSFVAGRWCPAGWTRIDDRCVSLHRRPRTAIEAARHCEEEEDGRLVSLEGEALAARLGLYLIHADPTRSVWVTSGRRRPNSTDSFEWLSSGQRLTYDLWTVDYDREGTAGRDVIALTHVDGQYKLLAFLLSFRNISC